MPSPFYFGVDYYPEHWPEARWEEDAQLMQAAGFNVVRLAEFAWSLLEPHDGVFNFEWLDRAIEVLVRHGLSVVLGTPSASVPPWLFTKYPDMAIVDDHGMQRTYGSRRDATPAHPEYSRHAVRIAREMAQHYAHHPHVIGWQIDNEFGDRCYSEVTRCAFIEWLQARYGSLDALNATWGTVFWSHVYTEWSQIPAPRSTTHTHHNPGLHLDYYRFLSDLYCRFQKAQMDVIRAHVPANHFITHNLMGFTYPNLDYFALAKDLDFVSWDNYPNAFWRDSMTADSAAIALAHAAMWGLKRRNFWVMEQQSGPSGWHIISPSPQPGQIALWAYQAIAHGADGIVFFRWRSFHKGAELNWHGILEHHGQPRRRYHEIQAMGEQLTRIADRIVGSHPKPEAALIHTYDSRFSFQIQPDNAQFSYEAHLGDYFRCLHQQGIATAVIDHTADLSTYKLVIAPALRVVDTTIAAHLTDYVRAGGVLVLTMRSGTRTPENAVIDTLLPGLLTELCGATVAEYDSLLPHARRRITLADGVEPCPAHATIWCDVLMPTTAEVLCTYADGYYCGEPAATINRVGQGYVIYAGTAGDPALIKLMVKLALEKARVVPVLTLHDADSIEVTERWQGDERLIFVLNHSDTPATLGVDQDYIDLLNEEKITGICRLEPYQVRILTKTT
ncbi:MAG: beta-galactosidase [Anaerolineae bacterium]